MCSRRCERWHRHSPISSDSFGRMPLSWEALSTAYPTDFTVHTAPDVLDTHGDCWSRMSDAKGDLREVLAIAS